MKILYGVPGEGMGHATRSKVVIDYLLKHKHDVKIVSSSRAYQFLKKEFPGKVVEIKGLHFAYKNSEISKMGTFLLNLKAAPKSIFHNISKQLLIEKEFKPELVISDFETFSFLFAKYHQLPVISIDNMQVLNRCELEIEISEDEKSNFQLAKQIVKAKVPGCDHYFISSFFDAKVKKKNTTIVAPIIRTNIQHAKVSKGKHILIYQTSNSLPNIKKILHQLPEETFFVYGMNKDKTEGNIVFKPFSEQGFIDDLASSKAVITNGGFSLMSEAIYLKKPVYSFPIHGQFEQWMNAAYLDKMGYGRHFDSLNADYLKSFLYDLKLFENKLASYKQNGNAVLFEKLDEYFFATKERRNKE